MTFWSRKPKLIPATPRPHAALEVLTEILMELGTVTEEEIERADRAMRGPQEGDRTVGRLQNPEARKLWALRCRYAEAAELAVVQAKFGAADPATEGELTRSIHRNRSLSEITANLFWAQAKDDLGGEAWTSPYIGIRAGFAVVLNDRKNCGPSFLREMLGE